MARMVPADKSDGEEEEGVDPKSWEELDAENGINQQQTPPRQDQETGDGGTEQPTEAATSGQEKKQKEGRPQFLVSAETIECVESLLAQGEGLPEDATAEERQTYSTN